MKEGNRAWITLPNGKAGNRVKVALFTTASRVVSHQTVWAIGNPAVLKVDLNDDKGVPLANGIYFLTVDHRIGPKALKLIILR